MTEEYVYRVLHQDLASAELSLEADVDEGYEIIDIGIYNGEANLVEPLYIGDTVMLGIPADKGAVNVAPVVGKETNTHGLLATLKKAFPDIPLPACPAGKTIKMPKVSTSGEAYLVYRKLSGDQIPAKDAPGAPYGYPRLFISHGKASWTVSAGATETHRVDTSLNPSGFLPFPYAEDVPSEYEYDLLGLATYVNGTVGTNLTHTGIRMWKQEKALLAKDEAYVDPAIFPYNRDDVDKPFFTFPKPITFVADEECKIEVKVVSSDAGDQTANVYVTTFWLVRKVGVA